MGWRNIINCKTKIWNAKNTEDKETEYKRRRTITKTEIRKYIAYPEDTISHLECDIYKIKPNIFKTLKRINKYIKESANINPGPSK